MKAIQATPKPLGEVFAYKHFVIPEFQRPYSWGVEQCEQLWDDIVQFCEDIEQSDHYFLGSIVVYTDEDSSRSWQIVDGQQRLTTLLILIKLLFSKVSTMGILESLLYQKNFKTGEIKKDKLRIISNVQAGAGRDDANDLRVVVLQSGEYTDKKSPFKVNYEHLEEKVRQYWDGKTIEQREYFITAFLEKIVLLPIECDSRDDALELFQIINNRGMQLHDADIFKSKIYGAIKPEKDRQNFIERWGNLESHDDLFRLFMHISRAESGKADKETKLRKYILDNHLNDKNSLQKEWKSIMRSLEICQWISEETGSICDSEIDQANEKIYWKILGSHTNIYWKHPVFVFLHKHIKGKNADKFHLPKDKQHEYLVLLRDTIRYFFIRGLVYNNVNRVRDTTFKVYVAIEKGENYSDEYAHGTKGDIDALKQRLEGCEYGRYRTGLIYLNSIPNEKDIIEYADALHHNTVQIEHILPRKSNNYDKWDEETYNHSIDILGNLMPLGKKTNIAASNEFFKRKKEIYKKSNFPEARKLSERESDQWYPEDVKARHEESNKRLIGFFCEPFGHVNK